MQLFFFFILLSRCSSYICSDYELLHLFISVVTRYGKQVYVVRKTRQNFFETMIGFVNCKARVNLET